MPVTGTVDVRSTPWDDAEGALLHEIGVARNSLRVEVLADREMVAKGSNSLVPQLATVGIAARLTRMDAGRYPPGMKCAENKRPPPFAPLSGGSIRLAALDMKSAVVG